MLPYLIRLAHTHTHTRIHTYAYTHRHTQGVGTILEPKLVHQSTVNKCSEENTRSRTTGVGDEVNGFILNGRILN